MTIGMLEKECIFNFHSAVTNAKLLPGSPLPYNSPMRFTSAFFWRVLVFPSGVWHVGCASQFMGCRTFSFSSCCRCCQNTKLVKKKENFSSGSVQLFSLTLSFWLVNVPRMISGPSCSNRNQPSASSVC